MCQLCMNIEKKEAFASHFIGLMNGGFTVVLITMGHRTGLFDVMAQLPPSSSHEIADAARLNERYVREWLNGLVVARIIEFDPETRRYELPAEHAAWLTRAASPMNLAVVSQYLTLVASVEDKIFDCFRNGGGLSYDDYPRFHEIMAEDSGQTVVAGLIDAILPLAPGFSERLRQGIDVLDLGCGRGRGINLLAQQFPNSRFTGIDINDDVLAFARTEAQRNGSENIEFRTLDATKLSDFEVYDLIFTFDAIHDQPHPQTVLDNIHRALRPGGVYLMQDIRGSSEVHKNLDHPLAVISYTISLYHCMSVSLGQGGEGLGTMWGEELAVKMLRTAGFSDVELHYLEHDIQNAYYISRK